MPQGYCFVSKGDVYITRQCRAKSKESRRMVYKVYDKKGQRVLGIRVPEDIWQKVLVLSKETKEARAAATISRDSKFLDQGRELLEKQYPLMPGEDIESVLQHAFCKGSGRVGRTATHSDGHKARLAVEAHIRHEHTPYDHLLKDNDRLSARRQVRNTVQTILKVWKGEKPETQESLVGRETRGAASLCDNTVEPRALEIS
ncbi:hypothetical protein N7539_002329 [Penicillium diatomitis]|uniref:DUF2293 domain-containing protein n=1 Tax=Penicillium diatomitis TaxID=2819901 RepID=A0A9W9XFR3_9EURO|nr:uncharacterized protein N7539_002329 [Penicillium diatomitis]KAJ5490762.1 hypothetical protein N7539_002329 [Penicillium diatomitis]